MPPTYKVSFPLDLLDFFQHFFEQGMLQVEGENITFFPAWFIGNEGRGKEEDKDGAKEEGKKERKPRRGKDEIKQRKMEARECKKTKEEDVQ
jgi:hypothetical protein